MKRLGYWWVLTTLVACGGAQKRANEEQVQFDCHGRAASYVATGHISGDEIGVLMDCADAGPRIKRWRTDKQGKHEEDAHALAPGDFNKAWTEINGTGWENLKDCGNGSLEKRDPVYVFDIKDDENTATFQCQTREVPYPYNDITDALDLLASQGRGHLGDDEPADAKALDKKDKQK
jgi:hypothetical protein